MSFIKIYLCAIKQNLENSFIYFVELCSVFMNYKIWFQNKIRFPLIYSVNCDLNNQL